MSKHRDRRDTHGTGSVEDRLARLLETPRLARIVPHLAPETLHQLIRYRGLDACRKFVAAATPEQLTSVLDLDLWRSTQPGRDERFDVERFGEWLEVLVDSGSSSAARTVAAIDESLVIAGLARYVRVFDLGTFEPVAQSDDERIDARVASADSLACEVGGYLVRARRPDAWDAIVTLLLALDADHHDYFHAVMRGSRRLSNSTPEIDGLDDLLMEPEQQLHDVALDREQRRSHQGYLTPGDARAFLQMARQPRHRRTDAAPSINPIVAAYVRDADEAAAAVEAPATPDVSASIDAVVDLLAEAGLAPERPRALLESAADESPRLTRLQRLMEQARDTDDTAYLARGRELAFLANALMAGCSIQSRPFTAQEASDATAAVCNVGLEHWPAHWPGAEVHAHGLVMAFEVGWAVLYEDVSLFAAGQLIATLTNLRSIDVDIQRDLLKLRRELVRQRDAGTPWRVRNALEVIAILDGPAWASLLGLLDECPVLPAALTATLEGHTRAVSATAFEFIATTDQIRDVQAFARKLPDVLLR